MLLGLPLRRESPAVDASCLPCYPPLSLVDLSVFFYDLAIALAFQLPPATLVSGLLTTLFYLCFILPAEIIWGRWITSPYPFVPLPSLLLDITIHLVRLAFVHFPHSIGRVFFSEEACLRLFQHRMGGPDRFALHCRKVKHQEVTGWWIAPNRVSTLASSIPPCDVVLVYIHGGGLTMGSPSFYLEMLVELAAELHARGFARPAIFAPAYSLAPEARFPTQLEDLSKAWHYVVASVPQNSRIGIGGDSAGGGLAIALMFKLSEKGAEGRKADFATLISPWSSMLHPPELRSHLRRSDFVSPSALQHFAHLYSGAQPRARTPSFLSYLRSLLPLLGRPSLSFDSPDVITLHEALCLKHPLLSPQDISQDDWWDCAATENLYISYGAGEVLSSQCHALAQRMREVYKRQGKRSGVWEKVWPLAHAPAMVYCYLGRDEIERAQGVKDIADFIADACRDVKKG